jgi:endo-1,4-beta-xylanase
MAGCRWFAIASVGLAMVVAGLSSAEARTAAPLHDATSVDNLTPPAQPRRVVQGAAVRLSALRRDERYRDTFLSQFDALTPENEMKMQMLQPRRGSFDFRAADDLVAFAKEHGKRVHGHALVWGLQVPLWLIDHGITDKLGLHLRPLSLPDLPAPLDTVVGDLLTTATGWTRSELLGIMQNHVDTVVRHFGDDVPEWDVVNEPLAPNGTLANNVWRRFIGPDYVELALRAAHAANPRTRLFINEYAVEGPSAKLDGLVALVRDLRARNVPLDGVGLQYHTHIQGFLDEQTLALTMRRLADLGVDVEITEMDVATSLLGGSHEQQLARQAVAYGDAARACNAVSSCKRFTTWGVGDSVSWLGSGEMPLLFDSQYDPKPAFSAVRAAFAPRLTRKPRRSRRVSRSSKRSRAGVRKPVRAT